MTAFPMSDMSPSRGVMVTDKKQDAPVSVFKRNKFESKNEIILIFFFQF